MGQVLSPELAEAFLADFSQRGRSVETQKIYAKKLQQLYDLLPEDKRIGPGTLLEIRDSLIAQGTTPGTVNIFISAANNYLEFVGRRELQLKDALDPVAITPPELTRTEYLRLLAAARARQRERLYYIIKTIANTGVYIRELALVTVEAVKAGELEIGTQICPSLRQELLDYCQRQAIVSGPIFLTGGGTPLARATVNAEIRKLSADAKVDPEKCNPLALRRLYLATQEQIMARLQPIIQQSYNQLYQAEELAVAWENPYLTQKCER